MQVPVVSLAHQASLVTMVYTSKEIYFQYSEFNKTKLKTALNFKQRAVSSSTPTGPENGQGWSTQVTAQSRIMKPNVRLASRGHELNHPMARGREMMGLLKQAHVWKAKPKHTCPRKSSTGKVKTIGTWQEVLVIFREIQVYYETHQINMKGLFLKLLYLHTWPRTTLKLLGAGCEARPSVSLTHAVLKVSHLNMGHNAVYNLGSWDRAKALKEV